MFSPLIKKLLSLNIDYFLKLGTDKQPSFSLICVALLNLLRGNANTRARALPVVLVAHRLHSLDFLSERARPRAHTHDERRSLLTEKSALAHFFSTISLAAP